MVRQAALRQLLLSKAPFMYMRSSNRLSSIVRYTLNHHHRDVAFYAQATYTQRNNEALSINFVALLLELLVRLSTESDDSPNTTQTQQ
jgi:hypothetical protein